MNIKRSLIIVVFFMLSLNACVVFAQPGSGALTLDIVDLYVASDIETFDKRDKSLEYNAFITEDWEQADLISANNQIVSKYLLKYDPYIQKIYLKNGSEILAIPPTYIKGFILKSATKKRVFNKFKIEEKAFEFLELIEEGEVSLYKRFETSLLKSNYNPLLDAGNFNDRVVIKEKYFLYKEGRFEEIPKQKKKAEKFFTGKNKSFKGFIKKNQLNLKLEADLIKVLKKLNKR